MGESIFDIRRRQKAESAKPTEAKTETVTAEQPKETETEKAVAETVVTKKPEPSIENTNQETPAKETENKETVDTQNESFLDQLNKKYGKDFKSVDDFENLFNQTKTKEIETQTPPNEKEEIKKNKDVALLEKYVEKYPDKGMQGFVELQKNWNDVGDIDVLRQQVKDESGIELSDDDADILIKKKYGIDEEFSFDEISKSEMLSIKTEAGKYRKVKNADQKSILDSLQETTKEVVTPDGPVGDTVQLSNGMVVSKKEYEEVRTQYEQQRKEAVDGLTEYKSSFTFKDANGEQNIEVSQPYQEEDKHSMLSFTEDTGLMMQKLGFVNQKGEFDHKTLNEGSFWANPKTREPFLRKLLSNVYSKGIDAQLKNERNINFSNKQKPTKKTTGSGVKGIDMSRMPNASGLQPKFKLNRNKN